ncbi:hypothetical protein [Nocardiopsis sp. FIRDI 009]|uniref:hypothetical protein n=1 Tax=Nocardiopsis sp. FIRDI 009 TaxID=714197 RepID=UPI001300AF93|nr:hypothetical protein [Nocardiopsis sp. FIRDI 009]
MSDKSHWFSVDPIPTLTCCEYLGRCEITVTGFDCYTWLNGSGDRMYMDREFAEAVVNEVIATRAGLAGRLGCAYPAPARFRPRPVSVVPRPRLPPLPRRKRRR